jgi:hypothetical protein
MRVFVRFLLLLTLSLTAVARADDMAERAKAASDLASQTLPPGQYKEMMDRIVEATVRSIDENATKAGQSLPANFSGRFRTEMERMMPYQELIDMQSGLLTKYYSAGELRDLATFYRTPLGQKTLQIMPQVMADVMGQMQTKIQREMPAMLGRLLADAPKKGSNKAH